MSENKISRRAFLRLSAGAAGALALSSCCPTPTPEATEKPADPTAVPPTSKPGDPTDVPSPYNEAPELKAKVEAGELPPVEDRLPVNPMIIDSFEGVGTYGGTLRQAYTGWGNRWGVHHLVHEKFLKFVINKDGEYELLPNVASEWSMSEDAQEFTYKLREGLKWSDGVPYTTEDIAFYYEHIFEPRHITGHGFISRPGGEYLEVEIIDELTVKFILAVPMVTHAQLLASGTELQGFGGPTMSLPKHWLSQFIRGIGDDDFIDAKKDEWGLEEDAELYDMQGEALNCFFNLEMPVMMAWKPTTRGGDDPWEFGERNPYYFKVDQEGNQLPYCDKFSLSLVADRNTLDIKVAAGEVDWQSRDIRINNLPFYFSNSDDGDYRVLLWDTARQRGFGFNESFEDDTIRELVTDRTFIEAVNLALDRDELNMLVGDGLNKPMQRCPAEGTPWYKEEWATRWIEYAPDKANELLDSLGMEIGDDGFRTRPDGQPFSFTIRGEPSSHSDLWEPCAAYLQDVGLNVTSEIVDRSLFRAQRANNELLCYDLGMYNGSGAMTRADIARGYQMAPAYYAWYVVNVEGATTGNAQLEPPADHWIWDLWEAIEAHLQATSPEASDAALQDFFDISMANRSLVGIWGNMPGIYIAHNSVANIVAKDQPPTALSEASMAIWRMWKKY